MTAPALREDWERARSVWRKVDATGETLAGAFHRLYGQDLPTPAGAPEALPDLSQLRCVRLQGSREVTVLVRLGGYDGTDEIRELSGG
jgi:hypothetical protein